jgi:hypothetical protein
MLKFIEQIKKKDQEDFSKINIKEDPGHCYKAYMIALSDKFYYKDNENFNFLFAKKTNKYLDNQSFDKKCDFKLCNKTKRNSSNSNLTLEEESSLRSNQQKSPSQLSFNKKNNKIINKKAAVSIKPEAYTSFKNQCRKLNFLNEVVFEFEFSSSSSKGDFSELDEKKEILNVLQKTVLAKHSLCLQEYLTLQKAYYQ